MSFAEDRLVLTPDDIDLSKSPLAGALGAETYVLGAFNPGFTIPACGSTERLHARLVIGGPRAGRLARAGGPPARGARRRRPHPDRGRRAHAAGRALLRGRRRIRRAEPRGGARARRRPGAAARGGGSGGNGIIARAPLGTKPTDPPACSFTSSNGTIVAYVVRTSANSVRVYTVTEAPAATAGAGDLSTTARSGDPVFARHDVPAPAPVR